MEMISVIVPMYNAEKTINKCIESILGQTYVNLELILINDGSSDKTLEICKEYLKDDSRIRIFSQNNKGVSAARNLGIDKANGVYIQFVDSDDYIDPSMCENLIEKINNNIDFVICGYYNIFNNKKVSCRCIDLQLYKLKDLEDIFPFLLENFMLQGPCNKLYKKVHIVEKFDLSLDLGEDLVFNLNYLSQIKSIALISKELYLYVHENTNSLTEKYRANGFNIAITLYSYLTAFNHKYFNNNDKIEKSISTLLINQVLHHTKLLVSDNDISKLEKLNFISIFFNNNCVIDSLYKYECSIMKKIILRSKRSILFIYYYFKIKNIVFKKR